MYVFALYIRNNMHTHRSFTLTPTLSRWHTPVTLALIYLTRYRLSYVCTQFVQPDLQMFLPLLCHALMHMLLKRGVPHQEKPK